MDQKKSEAILGGKWVALILERLAQEVVKECRALIYTISTDLSIISIKKTYLKLFPESAVSWMPSCL